VSQITNKNWNRLKQKSRSFAGMIKLRWLFFGGTRTSFILQMWCNSPSVSLPTKVFEEMLSCVEALDHVCPQFLWAESLLGFEQR
jgi:hypothetical protein